MHGPFSEHYMTGVLHPPWPARLDFTVPLEYLADASSIFEAAVRISQHAVPENQRECSHSWSYDHHCTALGWDV
jgi:hypothetical protein